ncbi:HAMP domain-containing protein [Amycolatopsis rubida]|uniref:histidine kinase n=1 Tax=Amycolatopsis rubida TaxID=112413 RepID=A0ABX0BS63_9PSEU|nr:MULTISPECIES: sensor histidine kinase [Amycolatopsis]MYW90693.1 histidine kinase [Amycolatopsis rubida]NEC55675.1 HAMP domain-containing protein [Amycolatopsis rubida]OAP23748.1 Phytochrome-like protein cph1 [Amycolatopsis sp. M39]
MKAGRTANAWPLSRWGRVTGAVTAALLAAAIVAGGFAVAKLTSARGQLLDVTAPQVAQANVLSAALLNQETSVRGYLLARQPDFLAPYRAGLATQDAAASELRRLGAGPGSTAGQDLDAVLATADEWRRTLVAPALAGTTVSPAQVLEGKDVFDRLRRALTTQRSHLLADQQAARDRLDNATGLLTAMLVVIAVLLCAALTAAVTVLHRKLVLPIRTLAAEVRDVTRNDITRQVRGSGPREMRDLAADVESLRARITNDVRRLEETRTLLEERTQELEHSNSDLEQFAYVASHDLQEPLRKVTSFCQLLQKRYQGKLDERGDQYIGFAVDGAKRMQVLINDLLAFSRVGRNTGEPVEVDTTASLEAALANLETAIADSQAQITHSALPAVTGEPALLTAVFQNLVANAIKFRGAEPPEVRVTAAPSPGGWLFSVSDNGIGVAGEYAERIFVIFQRLHGRADYPGTGIGLALCRKIVEHHGGAIWLDTAAGPGATFRFTLPAPEHAPETPERTEQP